MTRPITADQERGFYDAFYAQYLTFSDEELRCDRAAMARHLVDPQHPLYERRRLYAAALDALLALPLREASVLDYGCGTGDWGTTGFFRLDVALANPTCQPAPVRLTHLLADGQTLTQDVSVLAKYNQAPCRCNPSDIRLVAD